MCKKHIFLSVLLSVSLFGEQKPQQVTPFNGQYPFDNTQLSVPPIVQKNRFELNIDKEVVENQMRSIEKTEQILDGTLDLSVLQKPLIKTMKTIDTIYLHPSFITTLVFPPEVTITQALSSFNTAVISHSQNTLILQPSIDARNGNIILSISDGNKNSVIQIFVKQYFRDASCKKSDNQYRCSNDFLATTIKYIREENLSVDKKLSVIDEYFKLNNIRHLRLEKNLDYVQIEINKMTYYIIRDDEFGEIFKDGMSLAVRTSIN